jgi:hypothetical protein
MSMRGITAGNKKKESLGKTDSSCAGSVAGMKETLWQGEWSRMQEIRERLQTGMLHLSFQRYTGSAPDKY